MIETEKEGIWRRGVLLLFLGTVSLSLISCTSNSSSKNESTLLWDTIVYEKTTPIEDEGGWDGSIKQRYSLLIPQNNSHLEKEIFRVVLGTYESEGNPQVLLDSFALSNRRHDMQNLSHERKSYTENISSRIAYEDNSLVTMEVTYKYNGGNTVPHATVCYYNFLLPRGDAFSESSLFVDGYETKLIQLLSAHIEEIARGQIVNFDEVRPNGNFQVSSTGIAYSFPERVVIVDRSGDLLVPLSWEELKPILKPKSPVTHLIP